MQRFDLEDGGVRIDYGSPNMFAVMLPDKMVYIAAQCIHEYDDRLEFYLDVDDRDFMIGQMRGAQGFFLAAGEPKSEDSELSEVMNQLEFAVQRYTSPDPKRKLAPVLAPDFMGPSNED